MSESLGEVIREIRVARGLTQGQVAYKAGTVGVYICQLESGVRNNPSAELLARIALALGTTPDYILRRVGILPEQEETLSPEVQHLRDIINSWPDGKLKDEARAMVVSVAKTLDYVLANLEGPGEDRPGESDENTPQL